ncbi:hypothetical protein Pmar_PMAR005551, partial [Perkinsus marinus ATCC 50983]
DPRQVNMLIIRGMTLVVLLVRLGIKKVDDMTPPPGLISSTTSTDNNSNKKTTTKK